MAQMLLVKDLQYYIVAIVVFYSTTYAYKCNARYIESTFWVKTCFDLQKLSCVF